MAAQLIVHNGSCLCGAVSFRLEGKPLFSLFCHCTRCQRADGAVFVATMHFSSAAFSWTYNGEDVKPLVEDMGDLTLYRCEKCRSCAATRMGPVDSNDNWAIRGSHLERDEQGKIIDFESVKPTCHIFYDTRIVDIADDLPKWEGFANRSKRLD
ncbi:GFA domain-containing protein [Mycena indigotica]|uniref:GFA domain-containing protein n=1 Tax=Mycena indigotica TaxID=2126181 RepID=A0A8H6SY18_9AGAR|nr:GFA domain-containing protein [Mycena indigotica]KAF7307245.1 GFA domain-containing protein [Mycena indigotica]